MKIIQAVHINGTDKHKRYWKVPDHLQPIRLRKGDEAAVETKTGPNTNPNTDPKIKNTSYGVFYL